MTSKSPQGVATFYSAEDEEEEDLTLAQSQDTELHVEDTSGWQVQDWCRGAVEDRIHTQKGGCESVIKS